MEYPFSNKCTWIYNSVGKNDEPNLKRDQKGATVSRECCQLYLRVVLPRFDQLFAVWNRCCSQTAEGQQSQTGLDRHDEQHNQKCTAGQNGWDRSSLSLAELERGPDINMRDGKRLGVRRRGRTIPSAWDFLILVPARTRDYRFHAPRCFSAWQKTYLTSCLVS